MKSDRQLTKPSVQMLKHKNIYVEAYLCCHSNSVQRLGKIFTNFPVAVIHKQQIHPQLLSPVRRENKCSVQTLSFITAICSSILGASLQQHVF